MNALDIVNSVFTEYAQTCSKGDCATMSVFIKRKLEEIPRIQISEVSIHDLDKKIREGDIVCMRVPTLFAHFHYLTVVYEHKRLFVFQHYGSFRIPIRLHDTSFLRMIQDYVSMIQQSELSDRDLTQLVQYEKELYGLSETQINGLLEYQFMPEVDDIIERCERMEPLSKGVREMIKNKLETISLWKEEEILKSYSQTESHISIREWLEDYVEVIMTRLNSIKPLITYVDEDELRNYILEKLSYRMIDLYDATGHYILTNRILRMLFDKNTKEQKDTTEIIRYHIKKPVSQKKYSDRRKSKSKR
jgi:hypothetical protein